ERPVAPRHSDTKRYRLGLDRDRSGRVALGRRRRGHDERRKPEHQRGHELPGTHGSTLPVVIQVLLPSCCSHWRPDAEMVPPPRDGGHWALGLRTPRPGDEKKLRGGYGISSHNPHSSRWSRQDSRNPVGRSRRARRQPAPPRPSTPLARRRTVAASRRRWLRVSLEQFEELGSDREVGLPSGYTNHRASPNQSDGRARSRSLPESASERAYRPVWQWTVSRKSRNRRSANIGNRSADDVWLQGAP